jgi:hypothetical protein
MLVVTADSKPVKQEVNGTVIFPPLVFPAITVYLSRTISKRRSVQLVGISRSICRQKSELTSCPGSFHKIGGPDLALILVNGSGALWSVLRRVDTIFNRLSSVYMGDFFKTAHDNDAGCTLSWLPWAMRQKSYLSRAHQGG